MKKPILLLILCLGVWLSGCGGNPERQLAQTWQLKDLQVNVNYSEEMSEEAKRTSKGMVDHLKRSFLQGSEKMILDFREDGTYTAWEPSTLEGGPVTQRKGKYVLSQDAKILEMNNLEYEVMALESDLLVFRKSIPELSLVFVMEPGSIPDKAKPEPKAEPTE
jgi:hypothetical protein